MNHSEPGGRGRSFVLGVLLACLGVVALTADSGELRGLRSPDGVWQAIESDGAPAGVARISLQGSDSRALRLSRDVLTQMLRAAPREGPGGTGGVQIDLPMSGDGFSKFRLEESPIVAPGHDGRLPEIRTFTIRGVDDPSAMGRLSWTGTRLHALILSDRGGVFIMPRSPRADDVYVVSTDDAVGGAVRCRLGGALDTRPSGPNDLTTPASPPPVPVLGPTLSVFRAAIAATAEYTAYVTGNEADPTTAKDRAFNEIVATVNAANAVYERDLAIRLVLLPKEDILKIIYTDPGNEPYTSGDTGKMILENQQNLDAVIQPANYDIGHVFDKCSGGLSAGVGIVCTAGMKGQGVSGGVCETESFKFQSHYLIHEGAHQMGAPHSFNYQDKFNQYSAYSAYEVGSGSTIMSYAGCDTAGCGDESLQVFPDRYFHASSIAFVTDYVANGGGACAVNQATGNQPPVVAAGPDHDIPSHTPFTLTGAASDPDGDPLLYDWEEYDLGATSPPNDDADGQERPILRSYPPTASPSRTFPSLTYILENGNDPPGFYSGFDRFGTPQTFTVGEMLPRITRTMTFRLTVRDRRGGVSSDDVLLHIDGASGPFAVTSPDTPIVWPAGSTQTVTWNVAGTANPPVSCAAVGILLSIDGGRTFPIVLAAGTPNDGSQAITLPPGISSPEARIKVEAADNVFFDISNKSFVINQAPVIACPASRTVETDPGQCGAAVSFAASATDDQEGVGVACVPPSGSTFGRGSTAVICTATDTYGATDSCSFSVTVVDAEAPSITGLAATPSALRPPDHKMVDVTVPYQVADNCDALPAVTCALSVTSNEPVNGTGDGDKAPDWQILNAHRLRLREERAGSGTGRIYTIGVVCTDGAGNTTAPATTLVLVPLNTTL